MTTAATAPAKPKGAFITGIVLMVLTFVVFVVCIVGGVLQITNAATNSPVFDTPGEATTTLDAGEHALWTPQFGSYLFADEVTITGPAGEVAAVDYYSGSGTVSITKGERTYTPEVTLTAPTSGSYTVEVSEDGPSTQVLIGPPPSVITNAFVLVVIAFGASFVIGTIGLILLIIGLVKHGRAKRAAQGPPPGPYGGPGPYGPPPAYGPTPGAGAPPGYGQAPGYPPPGYGAPPSAPPGYGGAPGPPPHP